jgi:arylsulfatase A-like enzyme
MPDRMNIVLLLADQWRWDTLFEGGHPCRTPHLDRFMSESQPFANAFTACPLCTPARGALLTGNWPHQNCLTDNVGGGSYYPEGELHGQYPTYQERLRDTGYAVSYAGKWHLGNGALAARGIENVRAGDGGPFGGGWSGRPELDGPTLEPFYGSFSEGIGRDEHVVETGIAQIEQMATGDAPFFAMVATQGPHFPHFVPRRFLEPYDGLPAEMTPANYCEPFCEPGKPAMQSRPYWPCQDTRALTPRDWAQTHRHYWAGCTWLDECLGRLLARLEELGLRERTVVAFAVDHGEMLGAHGNFDKGPYLYEDAVRIPMVVRDPLGRKPAAPDGFVGLRDLMPTLVSLAGADGVLTDRERARSFWVTDSDCAFITYDSYQGREFKLRGIRTARHKYVWSPHDLCELYDLAQDPGERENLARDPAHDAVRRDLHQGLMAWMRSEGDYLLHARHLLPPGAYVDGRSADAQHDHGWPLPPNWPGPAGEGG